MASSHVENNSITINCTGAAVRGGSVFHINLGGPVNWVVSPHGHVSHERFGTMIFLGRVPTEYLRLNTPHPEPSEPVHQPPARVFISSTVHDLQSERDALRYLLIRHWGLRVYASDRANFPLATNRHSYEICRKNIRSADLVILIIDRRYGGLFDETVNPPISITRQETRDAIAANIPMWTFVRNATWQERHEFKTFARELVKKEPNASLDDAFTTFSAGVRAPRVQNRFVYDFIDEVTRHEKDNWIFPDFHGTATLLEAVEQQLPTFLADRHANQLYEGMPPSVEHPSPMIEDFLDKSNKHKTLNLQSLNLQVAAQGQPSNLLASLIPKFDALRDQALDTYSADMVKDMEAAAPGRNRSVDLFVADTSLEALSTDAWKSDPYHQRVIRHSERLAKSYDLKHRHYTRIIIIYDPARVFWDDDWRASVAYLIDFHKSRGIGLGVALRDGVSSQIVDRLLNFYMLRQQVVAVYDQITGMAFEFNSTEYPEIVSDYVALRDELMEICDGEEYGFWIGQRMEPHDFLNQLQSLIGFGNPDES